MVGDLADGPADFAFLHEKIARDERRVEIQHDHTVLLHERLQHVVGHVPGVVADRPRVGMREDDGPAGRGIGRRGRRWISRSAQDASEISMALRIVSAWTCAMSTAIPTRFISLTTISPNFDSPPAVACSLYLRGRRVIRRRSLAEAVAAAPRQRRGYSAEAATTDVGFLREEDFGAAAATCRRRRAPRPPSRGRRCASASCTGLLDGGTCGASPATR